MWQALFRANRKYDLEVYRYQKQKVFSNYGKYYNDIIFISDAAHEILLLDRDEAGRTIIGISTHESAGCIVAAIRPA